ncbi:hypothetical protein BDV27DRAFT_79739 [Aspergillus caelatus]|uniref:Uncharacterized protein n=1 Tax=Aspergillus caelatus TaxID=61420 RepID=A0A5N7ABA2_9EURO|nr:uncharacterized protein BDV27DRAFT_79739 [Aspergillus caelatus]KAE8367134.1 hypothetical protein BDV27DRAFT_79739 [Aspergillus caelatus]
MALRCGLGCGRQQSALLVKSSWSVPYNSICSTLGCVRLRWTQIKMAVYCECLIICTV